MDSLLCVDFIIIFIVGVLSCTVHCQPFSECPVDATTCCECVTKPGCVWSVASPSSNSSQSRCVRDEELSSVVNELVIPNNVNRPFNPHRKRYLRPQGARLKMSIGLRKEIPVQVIAQSRRLRLSVIGPSDFPDFSIEKGDGMSCVRRFRLRVRINRRRNQKKITIECHVSAGGEVQTLHLIVDMTKCYQSKREIKLNVRQRGSRRFKLDVTSSCQCPCHYAESFTSERVERGLEICGEGEAMTQCVTESSDEQETQCSGVNDYCRRNQNEPVCSGHGTCICGVCSCEFIGTQNSDIGSSQTIYLNPDVPETERQRYLGAHCQCDNLSCQHFNGMLCGGPERGRCMCGQCVCNEGYSGPACDETPYAQECVGPDGLVCGGQGRCIDGQCECHGNVQGPFCQPCVTCTNNMCNMLAPCVQCFAFEEMETNRAINCTAMCSSIEDPPVSFVASDGMWPETANLCVMQRNECRYEFAYTREDNGETVVRYQTELHCD